MSNILLALVVLALFLNAVLILAFGALTRLVRELQSSTINGKQFASAEPSSLSLSPYEWPMAEDMGAAIVLVVERNCPTCAARIEDLEAVQSRLSTLASVYLLAATEAPHAWLTQGSRVTFLCDSDLVGKLGVHATPTLLAFDSDGSEIFRRIAGDPSVFHSPQIVDALSEKVRST